MRKCTNVCFNLSRVRDEEEKGRREGERIGEPDVELRLTHVELLEWLELVRLSHQNGIYPIPTHW